MTIETLPMTRRALGAAALSGAALAAAPAAAQRRTASLTAGDWMAQVKAQHQAISAAFARAKATRDNQPAVRAAALKELATLLTAHSIAEEVSLYPGVAIKGDRPGSDRLYLQQSHAKVMTTELDMMPKSGPEFLPRLTQLESAVMAHVREEENDKYPALMRKASAAENAKMTADFRMAFNRYIA